MEKDYLLNIKTGMIHSGTNPCARVKRMAEANKKYFDKYEDAVNYFEGKERKGVACAICFPQKQ